MTDDLKEHIMLDLLEAIHTLIKYKHKLQLLYTKMLTARVQVFFFQ